MTKRINKILDTTHFAKSPIVSVAAKPGGPEAPETEPIGVIQLVEVLTSMSYVPQRTLSGSLLFAVDHCFSIRGQGTVMTGTVLSGSISLNDVIEIPSLKITKKVKSMQMFKQSIKCVTQGDRVGVCVTQFDPKLLERGLVCGPSSVQTVFGGIVPAKKIAYYKGTITTKSKFHITVGHETVMGRIQVFGLPKGKSPDKEGFSLDTEYVYQEELVDLSKSQVDKENTEGLKTSSEHLSNHQWLLIEFEKPVICPENSLVIGSRLDTDIHLNMCRIAFHGKLLIPLTDKNYAETLLPQLKVFKTKYREGVVERMADNYTVIGRSLFKKETNIQTFTGMKVSLSTGEEGVIEGGFGQSGKVKVRIPAGLSKETVQQLQATGKKKNHKGKGAAVTASTDEPAGCKDEVTTAIKIILEFRRYIHDRKKKMIQT
jgi:selenocysteine-specific elongation factor